MNTVDVLQFPELAMEALSYTLMHSLWQGLLILTIVKCILTLMPEKRSALRYTVMASSLFLLLITSIVTFIVLFDPMEKTVGGGIGTLHFESRNPVDDLKSLNVLSLLGQTISVYKEYITGFWIIGIFLFTIRLAGGYWYLGKLKNSSTLLNNGWSERILDLAQRLEIKATVLLAESVHAYSPMVIGYLKPVIIIPAGMASGLSTEQLEAIFIHELIHIKRNDYLLNLVQSLIEALYFFNPFVWILSSRLRTEREHSCDDAVLKAGANAKAYVHALASLEEARVNSSLALSLGGNKNELLERIKRLMEKSVRNYSLKEKIVPVLFLFIGLVCASWFSIQRGDSERTITVDERIIAPDTSIRKKQKAATFERKQSTVVAPEVVPHQEVIHEFIGDADFPPMISNFDFQFDLPAPPVPDVEIGMPEMENFDMIFSFDTIPPRHYSQHDWEKFQEEFTKQFQLRFGDFYKKNEGEIQKMMDEFQQKFDTNEGWLEELEAGARMRAQAMEHHAVAMAEREKQLREHEGHMKEFEERMHDWEKDHHEKLKELEKKLSLLEQNMKQFEVALKEQLLKDGYLEKDEAIRKMEWDDSGDITINGNKIKDSDVQKYRELQEKYLGKDDGHFHYSE
jgi:bla regulator protein blaR1